MKNKIKEVQDFFKNRIRKGEYEVKTITPHTVEVLVEKMSFTFLYHIASNMATQYNHGDNFMWLDFNSTELNVVSNLLFKDVIDYNNTVVLEAEKKLFEELKNKFEINTGKEILK